MAEKKKKNQSADLDGRRAVIYARYSPGPNQRDESIEGQIRECKDVAKRHGLMVIHEYADKRMTGTNDERPDFQRMLRDADRGLFDVVITWKNDRFARNRYDSAIYKQRLKRNGIKIIYAKEHIPEGPEGIILESMLEGMAEYYSANLSQNIRRGQRENAIEGKFIGGTIPLGYKLDADKRFIIDNELAPVVREIFQRYNAGESVVTICDDLNERGFLTVRKNKFNRSSLHRILANEKYIGVYRFEDIEHKDAVPRIVTDEEFSAAQKRVERNRKSMRNTPTAKTEFMLTGKIYCGICGEPMGGTWGTSKTGARHDYYNCNGRKTKKTACTKKSERKDTIEKLVVNNVINNIINNDNVINYIVDRCMEIQMREIDKSPADGLRRELAEAEKGLKNVMAAIEAGIITASTKDRLLELEERCATLKQGIAAAEITPPKLSRDQLLFIFEKYKNRDANNPDFIRDVIDTFVDKIYIYDKHMLITFNYNDGVSEEIPLTEVEEAANSAAPLGFDCCGVNSTNCTNLKLIIKYDPGDKPKVVFFYAVTVVKTTVNI
jgi:site-specific DNA recombinase